MVPCDFGKCDEYAVHFSVSENQYPAFGFNVDYKINKIKDTEFTCIEADISWGERFNKNRVMTETQANISDLFQSRPKTIFEEP